MTGAVLTFACYLYGGGFATDPKVHIFRIIGVIAVILVLFFGSGYLNRTFREQRRRSISKQKEGLVFEPSLPIDYDLFVDYLLLREASEITSEFLMVGIPLFKDEEAAAKPRENLAVVMLRAMTDHEAANTVSDNLRYKTSQGAFGQ